MVAHTPRSARWAPAHPVPAASSASVGDSHPSRRAGGPSARRRTEGTESVPRQHTRGHQLLLGLKGRGAARGTQHPGAGERRGMSLCQDGAVPAAVFQPCMAEPKKLQGRKFFCRAAAEDCQAGATSPNCCFLQFFAGMRWVLAPPMPASSPRSRGTPQTDVPA